MTTYICKCGRRVKKSTDASTTGNRLSGYAPGHECWGCPYAMPYGNYQWDESARTVSRETQGYECRMSKTLTYASEFAGSIKDKCTCRVHSLDFDFLSQVSAWIKDTYISEPPIAYPATACTQTTPYRFNRLQPVTSPFLSCSLSHRRRRKSEMIFIAANTAVCTA